jgi:hypothetical protein
LVLIGRMSECCQMDRLEIERDVLSQLFSKSPLKPLKTFQQSSNPPIYQCKVHVFTWLELRATLSLHHLREAHPFRAPRCT